ncbi:MAG: hypothetical protein ACRC20_06290 [Segniliparus sp.]|uniref:hypothetical protein n=1 Tax=Segniliparus sp. TaxID=2804064 RepID=UPI003F39DBCE
MKLRIDTEGVGFFCTKAPEQRTAHNTGAPRLDRETGLPLWQVQVMALDSSGGEVVAITVAGQPNVVVGSPVKVEGLTALPWSQEGRSGVAFRAESIRSAGDPVAGIITPNRPASPSGGSSGPVRPAA